MLTSRQVSSEHINPKADAGVAYAKVKAGKYAPLFQQENCLRELSLSKHDEKND